MKTNRLFHSCLLAALLLPGVIMAQERKTYKEEFKVDKDAVLALNTSHADLEFETWDQDKVVIEAEVVLEGASGEEAKKYFEHAPIEIMGNSKKIEVRTTKGNAMGYAMHTGHGENFDFKFDFDEVPHIEPFFMDIEIPDLPPMPPMPPMPALPPMPSEPFDYDKFEKEGEKYLKQWQKDFQKGFDEEYEEKLKEWAEAMQDRNEAWQERREAMQERMEGRKAEMDEAREKRREMMEKQREEVRVVREKAREAYRKAQENAREVQRNVVISRTDGKGEPTVYYWSSDGEKKKYKVKKTIRIKMPKSMKLDMNVRYGEVKLAELMMDLQLNLSHSRLQGKVIDGARTEVRVAYSPVEVERWVQGSLTTDFAGEVLLTEVGKVRLQNNSSEVKINRLTDQANISSHLGLIHIDELSPDFNTLEIELKNGELFCQLPNRALAYTIRGNSTDFHVPEAIEKALANGNGRAEGNYKGTPKKGKLVIYANYSEVTLD